MVKRSHLTFVEAIEALARIADLQFDQKAAIADKLKIELGQGKTYDQSVQALTQPEFTDLSESFRLILEYIGEFYRKKYMHIMDFKSLEEMKAVMILIQKAANQLEIFRRKFPTIESVINFKEYKQLQEFYLNKMTNKIERETLYQGSAKLTGKSLKGKKQKKHQVCSLPSTQHIFVDFETVKKDTGYELFFIRKENGSHYFSPRLLRNIKLICDFQTYFGEQKGLDPLKTLAIWNDRILHICAKEIMSLLGSRLDSFFHETRQHKKNEFIHLLNKALLALIMSSHSQNLLRHHPNKSCTEYFGDFQNFLRAALKTKLYQKSSQDAETNTWIDILYMICKALYSNLNGLKEIKLFIQDLLQRAYQNYSLNEKQLYKVKSIWQHLTNDYQVMAQLFNYHSNGPLLKVIRSLEEQTFHFFDPLLQSNLPNQVFDLYIQDKRVVFLRVPAPISQEFIHQAVIVEEFKAFLRFHQQEIHPYQHLMINLQDRTSWQEYARCVALEEFQKIGGVKNLLTVVTLATHTDFYHQLNPYDSLEQAQLFKQQFKEVLLDDHTGYFFPTKISQNQLSRFIDQAIDAIHQIFFSSKTYLNREERLDFIEILHWLLILKLVDWTDADSLSLTSKDSLDSSEAYHIALFSFLKILNQQVWNQEEKMHLDYMMYASILIQRERVMIFDHFNRMLNALKRVEETLAQNKERFAHLVKNKIFSLFDLVFSFSNLSIPK